MASNEFVRPQYYDHQIVDQDNKYVGTLRIKPNKILWAKPKAKKWKAVDLDMFAQWIAQTGHDLKQ